MVAGMARVVQDVLPFTIAEGSPGVMRSVNRIGMARAGIAEADIQTVHKAFRIVFKKGLRLEEAVERLNQEFAGHELVQKMIDFIATSQRGLARPSSRDDASS
jgi:UDP-N-acetylglucosamine acyltransferase